MVEHNPPPSADSARPPVNPCQSRSMSPMNSFLSSITGTALPQLFDPLGQARSIRRKASQMQPLRVPQRACAHTKISAHVA